MQSVQLLWLSFHNVCVCVDSITHRVALHEVIYSSVFGL